MVANIYQYIIDKDRPTYKLNMHTNRKTIKYILTDEYTKVLAMQDKHGSQK